MIVVEHVINSLLDEITYFVVNLDTNHAILIDPGSDYDKIERLINNRELIVDGILITHGHFDHMASCKRLQNMGYRIYISNLDSPKCGSNNLNMAESCNEKIELFKPDIVFDDSIKELEIGDFTVQVVWTPGHSTGGVTYIIDEHMFVGDTLFEHGYGRYDFYDSNFNELVKSVKKLIKLQSEGYLRHSGH